MSENGKSYAVIVKSTVIESLERGTSVLLKPRKGVDFSLNAVSGTVYAGVNQFHLQQIRESNGWKNPHFMTAEQIFSMNMSIREGQHGSIISYWADPKRYHRDMTDAAGVAHKKGEVMVGINGNPLKGYEYNYVFNVEQIDPSLKRVRRTQEGEKQIVVSSNVFALNAGAKLINPFKVEPGVYYKAKDNSTIEKFAEDVSRYLNSCYTGAEYEPAKYTKKQIKELAEEFSHPRSRFFEKINDGGMVATGQIERLEKIMKAREARAANNQEHSR
jgi:hypothetical protein